MTTEGKTLGDAVIVIADKMQLPAEHIYEVIVKAQVLIGILNLITIFIVIISYIISFIIIFRYLCNDDYCGDKVTCAALSFLMSLLPLGLILTIMMIISDAIVSIYMPEYAAIKMIGKMLGAII